MSTPFKPLRFSGNGIAVANFLFQVVPFVIAFFSEILWRGDPFVTLTLVPFLYLPAGIVMGVLQWLYFSRAISNLHLFNARPPVKSETAVLTVIPFVNLLVMPWLTFAVHERSMSLSPERGNTGDRSGWLVIVWYGTFIGALVISNLAGMHQTPQGQLGQSFFGALVGILNSALTKQLTNEITTAQEAREGVRAMSSPASETPVRAAKAPAVPVEPAAPAEARPPMEPPLAAPPREVAGDVRRPTPIANEAGAGAEAPPSPAVQRPVQAEEVPAASVEPTSEFEHGQRRPRRELPISSSPPELSHQARPPASLAWKLAALAFAAAAPIGTFVLASELGHLPPYTTSSYEEHQATSNALMLRAGAAGLLVTIALAFEIVRQRGLRLSGFEASLIWLGCALTLTMAVGLLFKNYGWLALGEGPDRYFFGGLPFGLAIAAATGIALHRRWHR